MSNRIAYLLAVGLLVGAALPAQAQQVVETSTGKAVAGHDCSIGEAMAAEIERSRENRQAETRDRLNALLDSALARSDTEQTAQSPVVFSPARPGS